MSHVCEKCGDEFDTERGLHIHQSQKHEGDDEANKEQEENVKESWNLEIPKPSLSASKGLVLIFIIGLVVGFTAGYLSPDISSLMPEQDASVEISNIDNADDPVLGDENASVTMVIYEDFQCPFCKRYEDRTVSQVKSKYIDSGEVKLVWKDFPLTQIHPQAQRTAEVMECVYRQDSDVFWSLKDKIYSEHDTLYPRTQSGYDTTEEEVQNQIISWASDEGINESSLTSCLENGNPSEAVQQDLQEGQSFDTVISTPQGDRPFVSGTPGTVIYADGDSEGTPIVGAQPFSAVDQIIQEKLES